MTKCLAAALAVVLLAAAGVGCKKDDPAVVVDAGPAAAEAAAVPTSDAPPSAPADVPAAAATGLDHPANDPGLVTAARPIANCPQDKRPDSKTCPAFAELARVVGAVDPAVAFDTLLRFLDSPAPGVRFAAAELLRQRTWPSAVRSDGERLDRVVAALRAERDRGVAEALGTLVGRFPLHEPERRGPVLDLLHELPLPEARKGLLYHLLYTNQKERGVFAAVREVADTDPDVGVRRSALSAFWNLGPERRDEIVPIWRRALRSPEDDLAAKASYLLGNWQQGVEEAFSDVVAETRRRGEAGTATWEFLSGLLWYVQNDQPFVDRQAVFDAARVVVGNGRNTWMARNKALDLLQKTGVAGFTEAAQAFVDDPDSMVARHARQLLGLP